MGTRTPWGTADSATKVRPGLMRYTTAGHGGFHVSKKLLAEMPEALRQPKGWYEEDAEWAKVCTAFPGAFSPTERLDAEVTLRNSFPEAWEAFYGRPLEEGQSRERDRARHKEANRHNFVAVAAWGDWHDSVPRGMIGLCARRASDNQERYALVTEADYNARGRFGYVLEPLFRSWAGPDAKTRGTGSPR